MVFPHSNFFVAFSWIEDENITSGNVVSILQHIWWCTDTQINIGLSNIARKRHAEAVQNSGLKTFNPSFAPKSDGTTLSFNSTNLPSQRKAFGPLGRVSKLCDAVVSTSGGRLLAQYFGQLSPDLLTAKDNSNSPPSYQSEPPTSHDTNRIQTDFYAEYLALPTSCSAGDFEAQVFFLMVSVMDMMNSYHVIYLDLLWYETQFLKPRIQLCLFFPASYWI